MTVSIRLAPADNVVVARVDIAAGTHIAAENVAAIDAVTGDLRWEYRRDIPDDVNDYLGGLISVNRNIAIYDTLLVDSTSGDYVIALDATAGEVVWETEVLD